MSEKLIPEEERERCRNDLLASIQKEHDEIMARLDILKNKLTNIERLLEEDL